MRALTLKPHWAHAVAHLGKRIENRKKPVPEALKGQRVAIHAGAVLPKGWYQELLGATERDMGDVLALDSIPHRAIVATAVLQGSMHADDGTGVLEESHVPEWAIFGDVHWWFLTDVVTLPEPVPWQTGQLGLWNLPQDVSRQLSESSREAVERRKRLTLAERLVQAPWWVFRCPSGQLRDETGIEWVYSNESDWNAGGSGHPVPDLTDAATAGVLLDVLCAYVPRHRDFCHVYPCGKHWRVFVEGKLCTGEHLGEAVAQALLSFRGE